MMQQCVQGERNPSMTIFNAVLNLQSRFKNKVSLSFQRSLTSKLFGGHFIQCRFFFKRFITQKVCTACSRTNKKIVPLPNLNKYLCNAKVE
jgi:hypothetical protein